MRRESRAVDAMQCRKFASLHPSQTCNFRPAYPILAMGLSGSEGVLGPVFEIDISSFKSKYQFLSPTLITPIGTSRSDET